MCPTTGRLHYQGYLEVVGQKKYKWMHENYEGLPTAKFIARGGTQQQAIAYTQKEETRLDGPWVWGTPKEQGKRNDILEIQAKLDEGVPIPRIMKENFATMSRIHKFAREYKRAQAEPRQDPPEITIYVGPSRSGKSSAARKQAPNAFWVSPGMGDFPLEGYDGQEDIIWDDFYGYCCKFSTLLRMLDRFPMEVNVKGTAVQFAPKRMIFTSNQLPQDWYSGEKTHQMVWEENPLNLRIQEFGKIVEMGDLKRLVPPAVSVNLRAPSPDPPLPKKLVLKFNNKKICL